MSIRKNTIYNLAGGAVPIVVALCSVPLYLRLVGEVRYGILSLAWLLLGYFGIFDLGLGRATAQRIASIGLGAPNVVASAFWTALATNVAFGVAGGVLIWPVASYVFEHLVHVEPAIQPELMSAIPWLVLAVPLATLSGVLSGALQGREQFLELNMISVANSVLVQSLPLAVAALLGPDLRYVMPAVVLARLMTLAVLCLRCRAHILKGASPTFSAAEAKALLSFGGWVTVTAFISPLMVMLDRFVIGAVFSAKAVTSYTIPYQLAERTVIVPAALATALFPKLASASSAEARELADAAFRTLAVVLTPAMLAAMILLGPFLRLWVGPELAAESTTVGRILLAGFWINGFAQIPYALLQAAGRPHLVARCHIIEVAPYLALLYAGLHWWGLPGAAMAFSLRTAVDCALLAFLAGALPESARTLRFPACLMMLGLAFASYIDFTSAIDLTLCAAFAIFVLQWAWRAAPVENRLWLLRSLRAARKSVARKSDTLTGA